MHSHFSPLYYFEDYFAALQYGQVKVSIYNWLICF